MILTILVLSEIIPKTLGAAFANRWVRFTAYAVRALIWLFAWAIAFYELGWQGYLGGENFTPG